MTVMSGNLYRALREAKVPDDMAQKAAEEVASFDTRFTKIEGDLAILKWMVGLQLGGVVALILKSFF